MGKLSKLNTHQMLEACFDVSMEVLPDRIINAAARPALVPCPTAEASDKHQDFTSKEIQLLCQYVAAGKSANIGPKNIFDTFTCIVSKVVVLKDAVILTQL